MIKKDGHRLRDPLFWSRNLKVNSLAKPVVRTCIFWESIFPLRSGKSSLMLPCRWTWLRREEGGRKEGRTRGEDRRRGDQRVCSIFSWDLNRVSFHFHYKTLSKFFKLSNYLRIKIACWCYVKASEAIFTSLDIRYMCRASFRST